MLMSRHKGEALISLRCHDIAQTTTAYEVKLHNLHEELAWLLGQS